MPKDNASAAISAEQSLTEQSASAPVSKTYTNWNAFNILGLRPVMIQCQAYWPMQRSDFSCHTRLLPKGESFSVHIGHDHGGGFRLSVRKSDNKPSEVWNQIQELALEAHDFRCAVCNAELRFHPTSVNQHLRPHQGMTKGLYQEMQRLAPGAIGFFNITLSKGRPEVALDDTDEFSQDDN